MVRYAFQKVCRAFLLTNCRLFFVFLNSFYSFYWDVAKDWDLTLFSPASVRNNLEHPWGLRRHTHFHTKEIYFGAVVIDLMLRCTWSFKLSPHLDHFNDLEGGIFVMEFLEILRRWMWIFFASKQSGVSIMKNYAVVKDSEGLLTLLQCAPIAVHYPMISY